MGSSADNGIAQRREPYTASVTNALSRVSSAWKARSEGLKRRRVLCMRASRRYASSRVTLPPRALLRGPVVLSVCYSYHAAADSCKLTFRQPCPRARPLYICFFPLLHLVSGSVSVPIHTCFFRHGNHASAGALQASADHQTYPMGTCYRQFDAPCSPCASPYGYEQAHAPGLACRHGSASRQQQKQAHQTDHQDVSWGRFASGVVQPEPDGCLLCPSKLHTEGSEPLSDSRP